MVSSSSELIPTWITEAAKELVARISGEPGTADDFGVLERNAAEKIATIIDAHAPKVPPLAWATVKNSTLEVAATPFGDYYVDAYTWWFDQDSSKHVVANRAAAKDDAQADYGRRARSCFKMGVQP